MRKILGPVFGVLLSTAFVGDAAATVSEPDGTALPQPTPAAEISVVTSRGFLATDDTLAGLFAVRGETLDPVMSAHQTPGTFSPQCGFTGKIVLHGGGCANALGWYNVTPGSTTPPPTNQIYVLVPANLTQAPPNGISCKDTDFCPMAQPNMNPGQVGQHTWVDYTWNASAIASDPRYKGGQVGFALIGNSGQCSQTKFSQAELNVMSTKYNVPWVTTLIYQSTVDPSSYYIAFEDLPMAPADWKQYGCDGDFNDFVFYVTGLDCQGGGVDCDTMMPGVCAGGTTQCSNGGAQITCVPNIQPSAEKCNGLDDDCDGTVDNPDAPGLCDPGFVCSQGKCIPPCSDTEFPCAPPTVCDKADQLCKDPACIGVICGAEQTCYQGTCIGGCQGVVCPVGQVCRIGKCVDPCDGVSCPDAQVCDNGACVPPCSCRPCATGQTCTSKGTCVDTGCDKVTCQAPQVCVAGKCQDGCQGVTCPTGQVCADGQCSTPDGGPVVPHPDAGVSTGGTDGTGGAMGTGGQPGTGGTASGEGGGSGLGGGTGTGGGTGGGHAAGLTSCSCDQGGGPPAGGLALLFAAFGLAGLRRRRSPRR
jgi:MYXO-CTERM domain-containing protein